MSTKAEKGGEDQGAGAKIIFVTNQKGGSGKSVTVMNLAAGLHQFGARVMVVDIDPQNTIVSWFNNGEDIPFPYSNLAAATDKAPREIEKLMSSYDFIIIDGRPQVDKKVSQMLIISDLIVIPLRPNTMDFGATKVLMDQIHLVQEEDNPDLKFAYLLNQVADERRMLFTLCHDEIKEKGYPLFKTYIRMRECYPQAYAVGATAYAPHRAFRPAASEVSALTEEVVEMLGVGDRFRSPKKTKA
ncbi:chromosome partitioning protein ParA [Paraburkholderia fungorum]|uniref:ParA family protein n=1 Tax=Paraburkholderia fungorum TaxID=134537 RepID=UPI0005A9C708|nr:ParA family protein [Paraburkholderia fungorum]PNE59725.1 chromosome partitioning protein ParA [Paraburkholderia fungorum]